MAPTDAMTFYVATPIVHVYDPYFTTDGVDVCACICDTPDRPTDRTARRDARAPILSVSLYDAPWVRKERVLVRSVRAATNPTRCADGTFGILCIPFAIANRWWTRTRARCDVDARAW